MSVELVNGHVLFPHPADWSTPPAWSRQWHNEIGLAVSGAETRRSLRPQPRATLAFTITPRTVEEQAQFDDRLRAALKTGLACAPHHGRGSWLTVAASGTAATARAGRAWAVGDYLFLQAEDDRYEVRLLTSAALAAGLWTLGFAGALTGSYPAGNLVWPLIFGELTSDQMNIRGPRTGPARITLRELTSPASAQLGTVSPPGGSGIGTMVVAADFQIA